MSESVSGSCKVWPKERHCPKLWPGADILYLNTSQDGKIKKADRAKILFEKFPDFEKAYDLFLNLVDIFKEKSEPAVTRSNLARWYNELEAMGNNEFNKGFETFENHNIIINYFVDRLTNASAESLNAKIKAFRTQFRGAGNIKVFMFRLATLYSRDDLASPEKSADPKFLSGKEIRADSICRSQPFVVIFVSPKT